MYTSDYDLIANVCMCLHLKRFNAIATSLRLFMHLLTDIL